MFKRDISNRQRKNVLDKKGVQSLITKKLKDIVAQKITYKGKIFEVITITELAYIMDRNPSTLKRMETANKIPKAPLRIMKGKLQVRVYPLEYAIQFAYIYLTEVKQNISVPAETSVKLEKLKQEFFNKTN
jgi:hypothetical protein